MNELLLALNGKMRSGKSTVAEKLRDEKGFHIISIGSTIKKVANLLIENQSELKKYLKEAEENKKAVEGKLSQVKEMLKEVQSIKSALDQSMVEADAKLEDLYSDCYEYGATDEFGWKTEFPAYRYSDDASDDREEKRGDADDDDWGEYVGEGVDGHAGETDSDCQCVDARGYGQYDDGGETESGCADVAFAFLEPVDYHFSSDE